MWNWSKWKVASSKVSIDTENQNRINQHLFLSHIVEIFSILAEPAAYSAASSRIDATARFIVEEKERGLPISIDIDLRRGFYALCRLATQTTAQMFILPTG